MTVRRNIRLLLADVDGSLVTSDKKLTEAARLAVKDLRNSGIAFAITSGRPPRGMRMLIEALAVDVPIAGFNGGMIVNPDLSVIERHILDHETAVKTVRFLEAHGLEVWVYTETDWFVRDKQAPHVAWEAWAVQFDAKVVDSFTTPQLSAAMKIVGVADDLALVAAAERAAQSALGHRASARRSQPYYLDVTHPQANKGVVLEALSKCLAIPAVQIATIGDMPSDVLMFRKSGFSIAMGNASEEVKAQADAVTGSNDCDGFAKAVREIILRQQDSRELNSGGKASSARRDPDREKSHAR